MPSSNETLYRPYGLGWKYLQKPESPPSIAGIARDVIRRHPRLVGAILGLIVLIGAGEIWTRGVHNQPITESSSVPINTEETLQASEDILTTSKLIKIAKALLETPGLNMNSLSFREQMQEEGRFLGEFEVFGACSRMGIAGEKGLLIRQVPSPDTKQFAQVGTINYGKPVFWIAEISVTNPNGSKDIFGLLQDPLRVTPINDPKQMPSAPNPWEAEDGVAQVEPGYVRLRQVATNGTVTWFVRTW